MFADVLLDDEDTYTLSVSLHFINLESTSFLQPLFQSSKSGHSSTVLKRRVPREVQRVVNLCMALASLWMTAGEGDVTRSARS